MPNEAHEWLRGLLSSPPLPAEAAPAAAALSPKEPAGGSSVQGDQNGWEVAKRKPRKPRRDPSHVVVLRGLPGSGKSTFTSWLRARVPECVVCSADSFFERGAGRPVKPGLTPKEVYLKCFDRSLLGAAHSQCQREFESALGHRVPLVVVDNTSTTLREFSHYLKKAKDSAGGVTIVELLPAATVEEAVRLGSRNTHGVPEEALVRMWQRWQPHSDAVRLAVFREPQLDEGKRTKKQ